MEHGDPDPGVSIPDEKTIKDSPEAWLIRLFTLMCHEKPTSTAVAWLFERWHQPERYRDEYRHDATPLRRRRLPAASRETAVEQLNELRRVEAAHVQFSDDPDRDSAADRALILLDGPSARLFLRYHAEARTSFHRAYGSLVKALEHDAAGDPALIVSPIEPTAAATPSRGRFPERTRSRTPDRAKTRGEVDFGHVNSDPVAVAERSSPFQSTNDRPQSCEGQARGSRRPGGNVRSACTEDARSG